MKENKKQQQKANIRTVAELVGVSAMTVSRALSGSPLVKQDTRKKIIRKVREMGYDYDSGSRILNSQRGKNIAIHVGLDKRDTDSFDFHLQLYYFLINTLKGAGLTGHTVDLSHNLEHELASLSNCGGLIIQTPLSPEIWEKIKLTYPNLKAVNLFGGIDDLPTVVPDDMRGGEIAGRYLTQLGHRHVAVFSTFAEKSFRQRYAGIMTELHYHCRDTRIDLVEFDDAQNKEEADISKEKALDNYFATISTSIPTAFFVTNCYAAVYLYRYLQKRGLQVPQDIGMIAYDNIDYRMFCEKDFTRVFFEPKELAAHAVRLLADLMKPGEYPTYSIYLPVEFIDGCSVFSIDKMRHHK